MKRVEVVGTSMSPTLQPGDRLLIWMTPKVAPGDLVAVVDPRTTERILVKRAAGRADRGRGLVVVGDNADASSDSRSFGPVPSSAVVGRAVYRYAPPGRSGPL